MKKPSHSERLLRRRLFLKAVGLGVAAPLAFKMSNMAIAAPSTAPPRLFIFYVPHGVPVEHFEPFGSGANFLTSSAILEPLAPFGSYVNVVRGLSNLSVSNHAAIRATLTGFAEGDGASSIDYTIAQALGIKPHALGAIPYDKAAGFYPDCFLIKHGSWVRPTESPIEAAEELLGSVGPVDPTAPDETEFRRQALALTEAQIERLHGSLQGLTREQSKLSVHLEAVRTLKDLGGGIGPNGCSTAPALPAVDAVHGLDVLAHENFGKVLDAHLEVAANAMICGTARVIAMQNLWVNSHLSFGFPGGPGVAKAHHDPVSHSWDAPGRAEFATCQRWFYERLATKLLALLDQPDPLDPTTTVLNNSLIYVCSEISDGANHNSDFSEVWLNGTPHESYLPAVLIGNASGAIAHREVLTAPRSHLDMLATLAAAMGVPLSTIGSQSVEPIQELLT